MVRLESLHRRVSTRLLIILLILGVALSLAGCSLIAGILPQPAIANLPAATAVTVHFIDVGQGDAALIRCTPGGTALIDGGPGLATDRLIEYLKDAGVETIDLLIATHPHEDHIGGLPEVFARFKVLSVIDSGVAHTTRAYAQYLDALQREQAISGCTYQKPTGQRIALAANVTLTILGPGGNMDSLNNSSVVARLDFGRTAFLFTGDALYQAEEHLLDGGARLAADVLKVSRHGSSTSTSARFLAAVGPQHAVISAGADNPYGHPTKQTLDRLAKTGAMVYRTDRHGDVLFRSDGKAVRAGGSD